MSLTTTGKEIADNQNLILQCVSQLHIYIYIPHLIFTRERLHPTDLPSSILPMSRPHMDLGMVLKMLKLSRKIQ